MEYRDLGRTGLKVSALGYGAWGIGQSMWLGAEDSESLRALHRAVDGGVNFIDTALAYGDGHSEELVGQVVRQSSTEVHVATKIPPKNMQWPAPAGVHASEAFPASWVLECTERSLSNLGLDAIDLQQFHVWSDEWTGQGDWQDAVDQLRKEGKVKHFGISINDHQPANAVRLISDGLVSSAQVIYNIFDQSPQDELFPAVKGAGVGVLARVPFDEGGLTGKVGPQTQFPPGDWRNNYFAGERKAEVARRAQAIVDDLGVPLSALPEIALRFCLSDPAVSTVIPGMRSVRNVEANLAAVEKGPLSAGELEVLRRHRWVRNFYQPDPL